MFLRFLVVVLSLSAGGSVALAQDAALVTAVAGDVARIGEAQPLQAFVKLKQGDQVLLVKGAKLKLVFFKSGRQETWSGGGRLDIGENEARGQGLAAPEIKVLQQVMVDQIARTPSLTTQGRGGATRLRSIPSSDAIAKVENNYRRMRAEADPGDLNPDLYLLSAMFEMHQVERVEQVLSDLKLKRPGNLEAKMIVSLYERALRDARASGK